jgi:hypothetical protein
MGMNLGRDHRYRVGRADGRGCMDVQVRGRVLGVEGVHTFWGEGRWDGLGPYWCWAEWMIKGNTMTMSFHTMVWDELDKCGKEYTALSV